MDSSGSKEGKSEDIECYMHSTLPLKWTRDKKRKYFDFQLQTEEDVIRGLCFSPERRERIEHLDKTKSPVKIRKYGENSKFGCRNIVIERNTEIKTWTSSSFKAADLKSDDTISSLNNVSSNQTVTVKGKVMKVYEAKKIPGKELKKQECVIVDSTGSIKVVLWESFINSCAAEKSYEFTNFTYKVDRYGIYIGSAQDVSLVTQIDDLQGPFAESAIDEKELGNKELHASVLGISSADTYLSCCSCRKRVEAQGNIAECSHCHMTQKTSASRIQWVVKLYVEERETSKRLHLTAFDKIVKELAFNCGYSCIDEISSEELKRVLSLDDIPVVYESLRNSIIEVL